jgi:hypothetical protein
VDGSVGTSDCSDHASEDAVSERLSGGKTTAAHRSSPSRPTGSQHHTCTARLRGVSGKRGRTARTRTRKSTTGYAPSIASSLSRTQMSLPSGSCSRSSMDIDDVPVIISSFPYQSVTEGREIARVEDVSARGTTSANVGGIIIPSYISVRAPSRTT